LVRNYKEAANTHFKKASMVQEGVQRIAQYETDLYAVREKSVRLRSLRLAKQATEMKNGIETITKKAILQCR
jgi:hypothetical protein